VRGGPTADGRLAESQEVPQHETRAANDQRQTDVSLGDVRPDRYQRPPAAPQVGVHKKIRKK